MTAPSRRRRVVAIAAAVIAAQGLAVFAYVQLEEAREDGRETPFRYERIDGSPRLPTVELVKPNGAFLSTSELRERPVLLHFWATWCPPCREELPGLLRFARSQPGLRVVAVTVDDDWAVVARFFDGDVPSEVVRDPSGALVKQYGVGGLPDTYLLDRNGAARLRFAGARNWRSATARRALDAELQQWAGGSRE